MGKELSTFICRKLTQNVDSAYLADLEDYLRKMVTRMPVTPKEPIETYTKRFKLNMTKVFLRSEYGTTELSEAIACLQTLRTCCDAKAEDYLRTYADEQHITVDRPTKSVVELAISHLVAGHILLLQQVCKVVDLEVDKTYQVFTPDKNTLTFPLLPQEERDGNLQLLKTKLSLLFEGKEMTNMCQIESEHIGDDFWFTIDRGAYRETESEVDEEKQAMIPHTAYKGKRDIVVYLNRNKCLYVNLDSTNKMMWLSRNYAAYFGEALFGVSPWKRGSRYTLEPFKRLSIEDLEICDDIPGIEKVTIYKLALQAPRPSKVKSAKEVITIGFTGDLKISVSESEYIKVNGGIPPRFQVLRAFFFFEFEDHPPTHVSVASDTSSLSLNDERYELIDDYLAKRGFDMLLSPKI